MVHFVFQAIAEQLRGTLTNKRLGYLDVYWLSKEHKIRFSTRIWILVLKLSEHFQEKKKKHLLEINCLFSYIACFYQQFIDFTYLCSSDSN